MGDIRRAYEEEPSLSNLLLDTFFASQIRYCEPQWRRAVAFAVTSGIPAPAMASALGFFDGYRSETVSANLIQAQRDYFGAHTYERVDKPRGEFFHTNWTGRGGDTAASTYVV